MDGSSRGKLKQTGAPEPILSLPKDLDFETWGTLCPYQRKPKVTATTPVVPMAMLGPVNALNLGVSTQR